MPSGQLQDSREEVAVGRTQADGGPPALQRIYLPLSVVWKCDCKSTEGAMSSEIMDIPVAVHLCGLHISHHIHSPQCLDTHVTSGKDRICLKYFLLVHTRKLMWKLVSISYTSEYVSCVSFCSAGQSFLCAFIRSGLEFFWSFSLWLRFRYVL